MPNLVDAQGKVLVSPDGDKAVSIQSPYERPEPDQPSPTRGDGELYNMVDPLTGIDQGGNPLMEGTLAQDDNGWQPDGKRDEYYSSKESPVYDFTDPDPDFTFIVSKSGQVYAASGNADYDAIAAQHGIDGYETAQGQVLPDGSARLDHNDSGQNNERLEQIIQDALQRQIQIADSQSLNTPNQTPQYTTPHQVSKPTFARSLYADPYEGLWEKKAEVKEVEPIKHLAYQETVVPTPEGLREAHVRRLDFLNVLVDGRSARKESTDITSTYGPKGSRFGHPVVISSEHPEHLAAAVSVVKSSLRGFNPKGFEDVLKGIKEGSIVAPEGTEINEVLSNTKTALVPLIGAGLVGRALLGQAIGGLVKGAFNGIGNNQAGPQTEINQNTQTLGSTDRGLTNDGFSESEDGDTHQYNDGDMSPDFQNPNLDADGGATKGEDGTHKSAFSDDSPGIKRAEELLEKLIHFYHSDRSGAGDEDLRDLDDLLENESPGYKDNSDKKAIDHVFLILKSPEGISHHEQPSEKKSMILSDNHQGPVTDEQRAAVTKLLQSQNRDAEVPTMLQEPWNYADELAEVTQDGARPNNVDPEVNPMQPPAPPAQMDPQAQMPVPDPQQSMAAPLSKRWSRVVRQSSPVDAQSQAPAPESTPQPNHSWQDVDGQPLVEGQTYVIRNPSYTIPDQVRLVHIKPESVIVENIPGGTTPGVDPEENAPIAHQREISRQEVEIEGLTFEPGAPDSNTLDPSFQATSANRDWLMEEDMTREAGSKFSPNEQREFIDEQGKARNADKLDLSGTHYEREKKTHNLDDFFLW